MRSEDEWHHHRRPPKVSKDMEWEREWCLVNSTRSAIEPKPKVKTCECYSCCSSGLLVVVEDEVVVVAQVLHNCSSKPSN